MASRKLAFADAVRLLDSDADQLGWFTRVAGVAAGTVTVATLGSVDLFALRDEIVRWGNAAVGRIRERTRGLGRFERTQRLVAAHSVIVVTSYFEALEQVLREELGVDLAAAELIREEQIALATDTPLARDYVELVARLVGSPPPMPAPHLPFEAALRNLDEYYAKLTVCTRNFLAGLSAFERHSDGIPSSRLVTQLCGAALTSYEAAYRTLAVQAPEFGVWAGMIDAQATRAAVADAVTTMRAELDRAQHATADRVRAGLTKRQLARLTRSVLSASGAPQHVTLPTLERAYIKPQGLVAVAGPMDLPATERWWEDKPSVLDVPDFLLGHLTGPDAWERPVVLLGQPGSGKSALTEVLTAELPASDFLVVRVELRKVHADSSVQQQVEQAVYQALGESVSWPDLVRHAGSALPVIIMDGFDELLQATGVNRADYLEQLQEFQQREAELGRPTAVLVTSRTVVADRARFPRDTVVLRLEPFDEAQVTRWLDTWNTANDAGLRQRGLRTLPVETVHRYGELATQPLLLLLLALYDAGANALQSDRGGLGRVELYERLFGDFVAREIDKHDDGWPAEQRQAEIDAEWRRLSAIAVAILNRGGDVIVESDLEHDLGHLLAEEDLRLPSAESLRRRLTVGQLLVGRFFFIHESQASRDTGVAERSFEFLHATFGEFLAARQIVNALTDLAEDRIHQRRRPGAALDAGFLYALTSFITVARRAPLWEFCRGLLDRLDADQRHRCRQLVLDLLPEAGYPHPTWSLPGYEPRRTPVAARHATYSANLVCLAVLTSDGPVDAVELVGEPVVTNWRAQALLWQSQLDPEDRKRMWQTLRVAWDLKVKPTVLYVRVEDNSPVRVYESLPWPPDAHPEPEDGNAAYDPIMESESSVGRALRRSAFVQTGHEVREHLYSLIPYWKLNEDISLAAIEGTPISSGRALLELLLHQPHPGDDMSGRAWLYQIALNTQEPDQRRLVLIQLIRDVLKIDKYDLQRILDRPETREETVLHHLAHGLTTVTDGQRDLDEVAVALLENLGPGGLLLTLLAIMGFDIDTLVASVPGIDKILRKVRMPDTTHFPPEVAPP